MDRLKFLYENWRLGVHLLFRTKRFGINNEKWSQRRKGTIPESSIFGWPWYKILWGIITIKPIIYNYRGMRFRSVTCYFLTDEQNKLIGWKK